MPVSKKIVNPDQKPKHWAQDKSFSIYKPNVILILMALFLMKFLELSKIKPYFNINVKPIAAINKYILFTEKLLFIFV